MRTSRDATRNHTYGEVGRTSSLSSPPLLPFLSFPPISPLPSPFPLPPLPLLYSPSLRTSPPPPLPFSSLPDLPFSSLSSLPTPFLLALPLPPLPLPQCCYGPGGALPICTLKRTHLLASLQVQVQVHRYIFSLQVSSAHQLLQLLWVCLVERPHPVMKNLGGRQSAVKKLGGHVPPVLLVVARH